jgi:hypothetical protein
MDRERARGWGIVHPLALELTEETVHADLVERARLLAGLSQTRRLSGVRG